MTTRTKFTENIHKQIRSIFMTKMFALWLLGVPILIIIALKIFGII